MSAINLLNKIAADMGLRGKSKHAYNLWRAPRNWEGIIYLFGYTPWRTHDPETKKKGYFAVKFRLMKNGTSKLKKKVRFGRRKMAKARAEKWYNEYYRRRQSNE